jgi:2-(1,2-epoxy-1,2-dihydrophenyl)acetyl-CoA isomerase
MSGYESIQYELKNGVVCLTMNRPEKMNSLDPVLLQEMCTAIRQAEEDDAVRVLVISGNGRCFCAGADLGSPVLGIDMRQPGINRVTKLEPFVSFGALVRSLKHFPKPAIAAINGHAYGGGLCIACLCDLRIAARDAKFSAVFVKRGLVADIGATFLLPRLLGIEKALELMWTGDVIDATEAQRIGLLGKVVDPEDLMPAAVELAERIASGPAIAVELMKKLIYEGMEADNFELQLASEAWAQEVCYKTADFWEGMQSFHERRDAEFKGE